VGWTFGRPRSTRQALNRAVVAASQAPPKTNPTMTSETKCAANATRENPMPMTIINATAIAARLQSPRRTDRNTNSRIPYPATAACAWPLGKLAPASWTRG